MNPARPRTCGTCTACCDGWLKIEVRGHPVYPGRPCPFSTGAACSIYPERPQNPCREFVCGWLVPSSPLPEWMRPDRADVILLAAQFTWRGLRVDVAVPVGDQPKKKALDWLIQFCRANKRPLLYRVKDDWIAFGPADFQTDMRDRLSRGEDICAEMPAPQRPSLP